MDSPSVWNCTGGTNTVFPIKKSHPFLPPSLSSVFWWCWRRALSNTSLPSAFSWGEIKWVWRHINLHQFHPDKSIPWDLLSCRKGAGSPWKTPLRPEDFPPIESGDFFQNGKIHLGRQNTPYNIAIFDVYRRMCFSIFTQIQKRIPGKSLHINTASQFFFFFLFSCFLLRSNPLALMSLRNPGESEDNINVTLHTILPEREKKPNTVHKALFRS